MVALFDAGHLGVPMFFVLSGFVMALTVRHAHVDGRYAVRFVARRVVRLTPPFYISIAVGVALLFVKAQVRHISFAPFDVSTLLAHLTYFHTALAVPVLNPVFWTLAVEMQFYLAFAGLMVLADRCAANRGANSVAWTRGAVFGAGAVAALAWPAGLITGQIWPGGFLPFWFCFSAGLLACWGWKTRGWLTSAAWAYCVVLALIGTTVHSSLALTAAATAAALLVAGRLGTMTSWLDWPWVQRLGLVSYSLYLLHNPTTGATADVMGRLLPHGPAAEAATLATTLATCFAAAWIAYRLVEQPSQSWSRRIPLAPRPSVPSVPITPAVVERSSPP